MMIKATDIRRGMVITIDGTNFVVVDFAHHTPGNLRAMVQTKLRNMNSGSLIDKRLRSVDQVLRLVQQEEFAAAMTELARLRAPLDAFFDRVTVNAPQADLRRNRLRLLNLVRSSMDRLADFSRIEG